jgi:probable F420-dependent oxidoreductase
VGARLEAGAALTIAVVLPYWPDRPTGEALEVAEAVDELGFGELWIGEMATYDAFALATAIGLRTSRVALTIGPLAVGVRSPATIAMGVASVANLTDRDVRVALGTSSTLVVEAWHERQRTQPAHALEHTARTVRSLLEGGKSDGGFRLRIEPRACSISIAGFGPRAVRIAAEVGDRLVLNLVTPATAARLCAEYRAAGGQRVAAWVPAALDPDDDARAQLTRALVAYLAAPGYADAFAEAGFGEVVTFAQTRPHPRELLTAIPPELVDAVGLVGDAATITSGITEYRDAGVDDVCVVPATAGDRAARRTLEGLLR